MLFIIYDIIIYKVPGALAWLTAAALDEPSRLKTRPIFFSTTRAPDPESLTSFSVNMWCVAGDCVCDRVGVAEREGERERKRTGGARPRLREAACRSSRERGAEGAGEDRRDATASARLQLSLKLRVHSWLAAVTAVQLCHTSHRSSSFF